MDDDDIIISKPKKTTSKNRKVKKTKAKGGGAKDTTASNSLSKKSPSLIIPSIALKAPPSVAMTTATAVTSNKQCERPIDTASVEASKPPSSDKQEQLNKQNKPVKPLSSNNKLPPPLTAINSNDARTQVPKKLTEKWTPPGNPIM